VLTLKETAELYRLALLDGWISLEEVVAWTDRVIEAEAEPDASILEASLRGRRPVGEMIEALAQVPGEFDRRAVHGALLGLMHRAVSRDRSLARRSAAALYTIAFDDNAPDKDARSRMWRFEDDLGRAREGIHGDPEQIIDELLHFLSGFPEPVPFAG
jgi:hypothetical protein